MEEHPRKINLDGTRTLISRFFLEKTRPFIKSWHAPLLIFALAFILKIWSIDPISNWDESWLADIAAIMAEKGNWLYPLYSGEGGLKLFDKPPFVFWIVGAFITVFGRSTIAVKLPLALGSACTALAGYLFFSHFKKSRVVGVIVGVLMAVTFFYNFYARTAYLDAFIYGLSALLGMVAIKAIDAQYKERNQKKVIIYLFLTWLMLTINILAKAWQGYLVLPAVALYLLVRHLEAVYDWNWYEKIMETMKERWLQLPFRETRLIWGVISLVLSFLLGLFFQVPFQLASLISFGLAMGIFAFSSVLNLEDELPSLTSFLGDVSDQQEPDESISENNLKFTSFSFVKHPLFWKIALVTLVTTIVLGGLLQVLASLFYSRLERPVFELLPNAGIELQITILTEPLVVSSILSLILGLPLLLLGFVMSGYFLLGFLAFLGIEPEHRRVIQDLLRLLPLVAIGGWMGTWTVFFLLKGEIFERDALQITIVGILGFLIILLLFVELPRWWVEAQQKSKRKVTFPMLKDMFEKMLSINKHGTSHAYFAAMFGILVVLSVFPFVAWIQHVDNEVILPGKYEVRIPGELFRDPSRPEKLNYTWLFFDYYVGWRYSHGTSYDLYSQFRSAIGDPVLIFTFPFFLVGLYFYFFGRKEEREIAQGIFFVTWLFTILFIFLPAIFQLNYYYLGIFLPYYGLVGKGMYQCIGAGKKHLQVRDMVEELMLVAPLTILVFLTEIPDAFLSYFVASFSPENFLFDDGVWRFVFFTAIYLMVVHHYIRDIPSIFSFGAALIYMLNFNFHLDWLAFYIRAILPFVAPDIGQVQFYLGYIFWFGDSMLTLVGFLIVLGLLVVIRDKIALGGLILLLIIVFSGVSTVSGNVAVNDLYGGKFEGIARFILSHGGDYNYSTWVFPDAGVTGAMRFYLGHEVVQGHNNYPFSTNNTRQIEDYFRYTRPQVAFWVVANRSVGNIQATSAFSAAYQWLKQNMVLADEEVGLNPIGTYHFFYNASKVQELMKKSRTEDHLTNSWLSTAYHFGASVFADLFRVTRILNFPPFKMESRHFDHSRADTW